MVSVVGQIGMCGSSLGLKDVVAGVWGGVKDFACCRAQLDWWGALFDCGRCRVGTVQDDNLSALGLGRVYGQVPPLVLYQNLPWRFSLSRRVGTLLAVDLGCASARRRFVGAIFKSMRGAQGRGVCGPLGRGKPLGGGVRSRIRRRRGAIFRGAGLLAHVRSFFLLGDVRQRLDRGLLDRSTRDDGFLVLRPTRGGGGGGAGWNTGL